MDELRSFETLSSVLATFREGTPLKAARSLSRAPSTVYRAIERLENDVGGPLFTRGPAAWTATELGRRIVALGERIESEVSAVELVLRHANTRFPRLLRISASDGFAEGYLGAVLADVPRRHRDICIELIVDNRFADLARREVDIAIRPDQRPGDDLVGRRAGKLAHALYCATPLIAERGMPYKMADLSRFQVCALTERLGHFTAANWWAGPGSAVRANISFVANTEMALAAAIAAGAGVGVLPCYLGDRLPDVRRITAIPVGPPVDIWLVTHPALRRNVVVRALMQAVAAAIRQDGATFLGALPEQ